MKTISPLPDRRTLMNLKYKKYGGKPKPRHMTAQILKNSNKCKNDFLANLSSKKIPKLSLPFLKLLSVLFYIRVLNS
jgi:hypothetical protein